MLFESRADLVQLISETFSAEDAVVIAAMVKPAAAVVQAEGVTSSWVRGDALLPEGVPWPSVDGKALVHTARIDLASVPTVIDGQPDSGHLSFFDGYPWLDDMGWSGPDAERHAAVVYTQDEPLAMQKCPLDPSEHEFHFIEGPTYVEFIGPYFSVPSSEAVLELTSLSWGHESLSQFSDGLYELAVEHSTFGQLFGNVTPIQNHPTPKPWNIRNDAPPAADAWDHLATFRDTVGVFDFYFSVKHADFADRSFTNTSLDCQCD